MTQDKIQKFCLLTLLISMIATVPVVHADSDHGTRIVTASNAVINQLLVYDSKCSLIQTVATQGQGGVNGNSGGIEANGNVVAVVNFGSKNVSIFERREDGFHVTQTVPTACRPGQCCQLNWSSTHSFRKLTLLAAAV